MIDLTKAQPGDPVFVEATEPYGVPFGGTIFKIGMYKSLTGQRRVGSASVVTHPGAKQHPAYGQAAIIEVAGRRGIVMIVGAGSLFHTAAAASESVLDALERRVHDINDWIENPELPPARLLDSTTITPARRERAPKDTSLIKPAKSEHGKKVLKAIDEKRKGEPATVRRDRSTEAAGEPQDTQQDAQQDTAEPNAAETAAAAAKADQVAKEPSTTTEDTAPRQQANKGKAGQKSPAKSG